MEVCADGGGNHRDRRCHVLDELVAALAALEAVKLAKEQGYLTFDDLNEHLPESVSDPEEMELIMNRLRGMEIDIRDLDHAVAVVAAELDAASLVDAAARTVHVPEADADEPHGPPEASEGVFYLLPHEREQGRRALDSVKIGRAHV